MSRPVIDLTHLLNFDGSPEEFTAAVVGPVIAAGVTVREAARFRDPLEFDGPADYCRYIKKLIKDRYEVQLPAIWEAEDADGEGGEEP